MDYSSADLITAYRALQLDPNNTHRLIAFKSLCWKHVLDHASPEWIQHAQNGMLPLTWRSELAEGNPGGRHLEYDDTLGSLACDFVRLYADTIWPLSLTMRSHLISNLVKPLRAVRGQVRAERHVIERLERLRGVRATERVYVAESRIGRKVREFLKELVLTTGVPLLETGGAERLLLAFLGRETLLAPVYASSGALRAHQQLQRPVITHATAIFIDLTNDDDDDDNVVAHTHADESGGAGLVSVSSPADVQAAPGDSSDIDMANPALHSSPNGSCEQVSSKPEKLATRSELDHPVSTHATPSVNQTTTRNSMNGSGTMPWDVWFPTHQSDSQTVSQTPAHPKITSARYPCLHQGCGRIYAWSEALATHQDLAHPVVARVVPQAGSNQDLAHPMIPQVTSQTGHQDLAHPVVPQVAPKAEPSIENSTSGVNLVTVIDLVGSEDENEEDEIRGLLCTHEGCRLRFLDWASFDAHAQLPHDGDDVLASSGENAHRWSGNNGIHTSNSFDGVSSLLQAVETPVLEESHVEASSSGVQWAPNQAESPSGDMTRWRSMYGKRV